MGILSKMGFRQPPPVVVLDAETLELQAELEVGGVGASIAASKDAVWITSPEARTVSRVDPVTRTVTATLELERRPRQVVVDGEHPLVLCEGDVVVRVEPDASALAGRGQLPSGVREIAADAGTLWALRDQGGDAAGHDFSLVRVEPGSLSPGSEVPLPRSRHAGALRVRDGAVTALAEVEPGAMGGLAFDADDGSPLPADRVPAASDGLAERDGARWIVDGTVVRRMSVTTGHEIAEAELPGPEVAAVAYAFDQIWAANYRLRRSGEAV